MAKKDVLRSLLLPLPQLSNVTERVEKHALHTSYECKADIHDTAAGLAFGRRVCQTTTRPRIKAFVTQPHPACLARRAFPKWTCYSGTYAIERDMGAEAIPASLKDAQNKGADSTRVVNDMRCPLATTREGVRQILERRRERVSKLTFRMLSMLPRYLHFRQGGRYVLCDRLMHDLHI